MPPKNRTTEFVNIAITEDARQDVVAATARAGGLTEKRVPQHRAIRAAIIVAFENPDRYKAVLEHLAEHDA